MDFLRSMKPRKKSNSKDATKNKKKQDNSSKVKKKGTPEKNKSMRSTKNRKAKNVKMQKSRRERKSSGNLENANLAINIFDQETFSFRIETCVHPDPSIHTSLQIQAFESFAASILSSGVEGLIKEYTETLLPFVPVGYFERKIFDQNTELKKNRYKDVVCNDKTRVILNDGRPGDYIHANYLKGSKPLYILTQGPLKDSQMDMWRMVIQEGVAAICMLCELVEHGRPKCEPYFPDAEGQSITFGEITVTCTEYTLPDVHTQLKALTVVDKKTGKTHKLNHYKIVTWPDKTIPLSNLSVLRTHRILRKMNGPVVVHCSAGVGRTGTFAAIEVGVQCLLNGKTFRPVDLVKAVRHCRLHSVQMDTQYLMLVEAILDTGVAFKYIEDSKLLDAIETYKKQTADYVEAHPPPIDMVKTPVKKEKETEETPAPPQIQPQSPAPTNTIYPILSNPIGPPPVNPPSPSPAPPSSMAPNQAVPTPDPPVQPPAAQQVISPQKALPAPLSSPAPAGTPGAQPTATAANKLQPGKKQQSIPLKKDKQT
ncbi:hypothetical protein GCK72_002122 [Caenorhabditis remanei]|uniref:Uncharacterized protein n=1 Tax=Caenorhabditis remanei TaxID=31234 RepID=A0A6A5HUH6_CAERE|nr:hypothetical protein GCK72_002122 [Caenorhabditis remanei]KAF1770304.1 hypothetical protein GCK72_002122 [Caenorhabditis remanei]